MLTPEATGVNWAKKEDNFVGLIPKLSKRIGLLKRIKKYMTYETFNTVMNGIFNSTMIYCLPVFGNIWLQGDEQLRFRSFKKEDLRRLQVLQNRVLRLLTDLPYYTSTEMLVKKSNTMSIHQLTAYHSLLMTHKITVSKKPEYL